MGRNVRQPLIFEFVIFLFVFKESMSCLCIKKIRNF